MKCFRASSWWINEGLSMGELEFDRTISSLGEDSLDDMITGRKDGSSKNTYSKLSGRGLIQDLEVFTGPFLAVLGDEGDGVSNWTSSGVIGERSIEDEEVSLVYGVLEGALGALGDEIGSLGDGVVVSSWVKSKNNCFGGMMLIFGLLETLEIEALVEIMEVYSG
ncbi:hypothetical protein Tco_1524850 [Tanacetum coccineum]